MTVFLSPASPPSHAFLKSEAFSGNCSFILSIVTTGLLISCLYCLGSLFSDQTHIASSSETGCGHSIHSLPYLHHHQLNNIMPDLIPCKWHKEITISSGETTPCSCWFELLLAY